ncbi:hypothetical protein [Streptomyces sp. NPDC050982]|uniref:hypothetical protein n=1 Tax=Streptomyces sp. NPDC050982 TaxID=3154746 RepID=UPI0033CD8544
MMQLHQHLVGVGLSATPPLVEFIPWTQDAYAERSVVREGYLQRPQAPGASTAITPRARHNWQLRGIGALRKWKVVPSSIVRDGRRWCVWKQYSRRSRLLRRWSRMACTAQVGAAPEEGTQDPLVLRHRHRAGTD